MKSLWTLALWLPLTASAYTLNNTIGARFKDDDVKVRVGINPTACANVDLNELSGLIDDSVDKFWNTVPTSRLNLKASSSDNTGDDDYLTGELCLTGSTCGGTPVPGPDDILITCNNNGTNFPGGSSLLALTLPNVISGKNIKGAVVLINDTNTAFDDLSRDKKVAVIAHELGHAIGLGHSEKSEALMYYAVVPRRESLSHDDIVGLTYLYPVKMDMFGAGCFLGSVAITGQGGGPGTGGSAFWPTALLGLLLALMFGRRLKKST